MAARASMVELVRLLRSHTGAATNDVFQGVTYWSDDQLQAELDAQRSPVWAAGLVPIPQKISGSTVYHNFAFVVPRGTWIENAFVLRDSNGDQVTSPTFTVVLVGSSGAQVTFASDVGNVALTIEFYAIDWHAAAASVWEQKAAHRFDYIDVKAGDHRFSARQEYETCVQRAAYHAGKKIRSFSFDRANVIPQTSRRYRP